MAILQSTPPRRSLHLIDFTLRSVKGFLKGLCSSLKEKPAPADVVAGPELRLGRTDSSPR
jgi:hypothetical protein